MAPPPTASKAQSKTRAPRSEARRLPGSPWRTKRRPSPAPRATRRNRSTKARRIQSTPKNSSRFTARRGNEARVQPPQHGGRRERLFREAARRFAQGDAPQRIVSEAPDRRCKRFDVVRLHYYPPRRHDGMELGPRPRHRDDRAAAREP